MYIRTTRNTSKWYTFTAGTDLETYWIERSRTKYETGVPPRRLRQYGPWLRRCARLFTAANQQHDRGTRGRPRKGGPLEPSQIYLLLNIPHLFCPHLFISPQQSLSIQYVDVRRTGRSGQALKFRSHPTMSRAFEVFGGEKVTRPFANWGRWTVEGLKKKRESKHFNPHSTRTLKGFLPPKPRKSKVFWLR